MSASDTGPRRAGPRAPISLGDAIVAVCDLDPQDDAARATVLAVLGLVRTRAEDAVAAVASGTDARRSQPPPAQRLTDVAAARPAAAAAKQAPSAPIPSQLVRSGRLSPAVPAWLEQEGDALARARRTAPPPPAPIFAPIEQRGIFVAALSSWVDEGDVDIDAAVRIVAKARPLTSVPRTPLRTLRRGVQLLIDRGPGMEPFAADAHGLERSIGRLMGANEVECFYFQRCPRRGVRETASSRRTAWRPPPREMPLLVVSDFGLAAHEIDTDGAGLDEWLRFAREVHGEGHALVGLIPFAPDRWPAALAEAIALVHWSERTAAGAVAAAVRAEHRRMR